VIKSKGCAFLEFKHRNALQQGLKLHHSSLDGRQINVELTAGGGGKGEARLSKLKERNKELESQRVSRVSSVVYLMLMNYPAQTTAKDSEVTR
jgi:nucleolar protein 6